LHVRYAISVILTMTYMYYRSIGPGPSVPRLY